MTSDDAFARGADRSGFELADPARSVEGLEPRVAGRWARAGDDAGNLWRRQTSGRERLDALSRTGIGLPGFDRRGRGL